MVFFNYAQTNSWHDTPAGLIDAGATRSLMQMVADAYEGALVVWEENNINMLANRERAGTSRGGENGKGKGTKSVSEEDPFDLGPNEAQRKVLDWLVEARYLPSPTLSSSCSPLANNVSVHNENEHEDIWANLPQTPTKAKVRRPAGGRDSPSPPTHSSIEPRLAPSKTSTLPPTFSLNLLSRRPATPRSHSTPSPDTRNNTSASPWRLALSRSNTSNSAKSLPASFQVSGSSMSPKKMWAALKTRVRTLESDREGLTEGKVTGTVNARLPEPPASPSPAPRRTAKRRNTTAVEVRAEGGLEDFGPFPAKVNVRAETKTMGGPAELKPHHSIFPPSRPPAALPVNGKILPLHNLKSQGVRDGVPMPSYNTATHDEQLALGPQAPINPIPSAQFPVVDCSPTSPYTRSAQPFLPRRYPSTPHTPDLSLSLSTMPSLVSATPSGYESLFSSSSALSSSSSPPPTFTTRPNSKPERNTKAKEEEHPVTLWTLFVLTAFGYLAFFVLFLVCLCVGVWRMVGCFGTKDDED
ncbi:hypothetical protein NLJ89_g6969 [Agrocybe chaxingu]|uniref:Uncharacterized protein n=1 Tax=Agrocybe chaxingu TaxID=84603 RepID=A0A9W8JVF0_9AGAR|nr:hypothetical protein NLJ89_g6969 [Agrocybe chaxingu]